jgi:hypothetical protein
MKDIDVINKLMVRNVFLNTEILLNEGETEIFEYDIQAYMFLFLRTFLRSYEYTAGREKAGKVDCVLFGKNTKPVVFYEIKTYFKESEKIKESHFVNDIEKLAELIKNNVGSKGYFFTSGLTKKFQEGDAMKLPFIAAHVHNSRKWSDLTLANGDIVRLRPSVKECNGQSNTMTWEVVL